MAKLLETHILGKCTANCKVLENWFYAAFLGCEGQSRGREGKLKLYIEARSRYHHILDIRSIICAGDWQQCLMILYPKPDDIVLPIDICIMLFCGFYLWCISLLINYILVTFCPFSSIKGLWVDKIKTNLVRKYKLEEKELISKNPLQYSSIGDNSRNKIC